MQYVKVEPSRLPTTNIFVHSLISRIKHNPYEGVDGFAQNLIHKVVEKFNNYVKTQ